MLTSIEIADYRLIIGDDELRENESYILSDSHINYLYDKAQGNHSLAVVFMLRRILGWARKKVNQSNPNMGTQEQYKQLFDNTKELYDEWLYTYKEFSSVALGTEDSADGKHIEGLGMLDMQTSYYNIPLDNGHYDEMVARLNAIYGRG